MAQSSAPRRSGRGVLGCVLLFLLILVLALIAAGLLFFGGETATAAVNIGPIVNIVSPPNGHRAELNVPLLVQARAEHSSRMTRVELYADGALVAVQSSTLPNGSNPLIFMQQWAAGDDGTPRLDDARLRRQWQNRRFEHRVRGCGRIIDCIGQYQR